MNIFKVERINDAKYPTTEWTRHFATREFAEQAVNEDAGQELDWSGSIKYNRDHTFAALDAITAYYMYEIKVEG